MKIYDCADKTSLETVVFPKERRESENLFIICLANEIPILREVFYWDESTVAECTNLDESVRCTNFDGYDFISLVHMELDQDDFLLREINFYVSARYLALVLPERASPKISQLEAVVCAAAENFGVKTGYLNKLYFFILHRVLADFSDMLEELEDKMEVLSERIMQKPDQKQLLDIGNLRRVTYVSKKQLRALSYLGEQILMDENDLIDKKGLRYIRNIETRIRKLYSFTENLHDATDELLRTYDSRLTMKMNDMVHKLTMLTLFFGPLTVITGIYGMNFEFMPELRWYFGYPMVLGIMVTVTFALYLVLKKNKWM